MTPKEKAFSLFAEYASRLNDGRIAKRCALIAVDEIINCLDDDDLYIQGESNIDEFISYYKEIKREIEKL